MPHIAIVHDSYSGKKLERFLIDAQEMCRLDDRYSIIDSTLLEVSGAPNNSQQTRDLVGQYGVLPEDRVNASYN